MLHMQSKIISIQRPATAYGIISNVARGASVFPAGYFIICLVLLAFSHNLRSAWNSLAHVFVLLLSASGA